MPIQEVIDRSTIESSQLITIVESFAWDDDADVFLSERGHVEYVRNNKIIEYFFS